MRDQHKLGHT